VNKFENLENALNKLQMHFLIDKISSIYETPPWGVEDQPSFYNQCIGAFTDKKPHEVIQITQNIEKDIGKKTLYKWGPRQIDIDLLLYNDLIVDDSHLKVPHPNMHERAFVLIPLSDIACDEIHPILNLSVGKLSEKYNDVSFKIVKS